MPSKEICSWQMEGRKFEDKSGVGVLHWQKTAKWTMDQVEQWRYTFWRRLKRHSVGRGGTSKRSRNAARRTPPGVRAALSFESRE